MENVNGTNGGHGADHEGRHVQARLPKKLIVCCDGTWMDSNDSTGLPSNVTRLARAIKSEDNEHHPQIVYYQAGVGTGLGLFDRLGGGGTGLGLAEHIREGYAFLASNYSHNDEKVVKPDSIFLVGFSRGAYTARSLGGFITAFGILKKHAMTYFYDIYRDWEHAGEASWKPRFFDEYFKHNDTIKKTKPDRALAGDETKRDEYIQRYFQILQDLGLTQKVPIQAIGVFDTVGALGVPVHPILQRIIPGLPAFIHEAKWFDTRLDSQTKNAFQALALDEKRFPYGPAVWELRPDPHTGAVPTTNLKQVWFPGAHSNIGGSYADSGIADITLAWMMDQLSGHGSRPPATTSGETKFQAREWLQFDPAGFDTLYDERTAHSRTQLTTAAAQHTPYRGWALGRVYDSNTFPGSLLLGSKCRTPGLYHRTIYATGKADPKHLLTHTNERIHSCVRVRVDFGGRGVEPVKKSGRLSLGFWIWKLFRGGKVAAYRPQDKGQPLHRWRLLDGHDGHEGQRANGAIATEGQGKEEVVWAYEGPEKCESKVIQEDRLGGFWERKLLEKMSPSLAEQVEYSNNGWKVVTKLPATEPTPSKTI